MEWNSGTVEWWNGGILEWRLTTLYRFYLNKWTNWACALEIDVGMVWMRGYLQVERVYQKEPVHVLLYYA